MALRRQPDNSGHFRCVGDPSPPMAEAATQPAQAFVTLDDREHRATAVLEEHHGLRGLHTPEAGGLTQAAGTAAIGSSLTAVSISKWEGLRRWLQKPFRPPSTTHAIPA